MSEITELFQFPGANLFQRGFCARYFPFRWTHDFARGHICGSTWITISSEPLATELCAIRAYAGTSPEYEG